jgi:hypothetical protein
MTPSQDSFTPGPWLVVADGDDDEGYTVVAGPHEDPIAIPQCALDDATEIANARLIAAAPDLLNGCRALLGLIQLISGRDDIASELQEVLGSNHRIAEAEAAIAKATQSQQNGSPGEKA